jgi:hypothetical protein
VEYWATLGRIVEHSGLTAQEAQTAIANYEADGSLAQRAREVVASNRSNATGADA